MNHLSKLAFVASLSLILAGCSGGTTLPLTGSTSAQSVRTESAGRWHPSEKIYVVFWQQHGLGHPGLR